MSYIPEEDVKLVVSGIDDAPEVEEFSPYVSLDHAIRERILPAAGATTGDLYIVSPYLIPELIHPNPPAEEDSSLSTFSGWFRNFVELDGTRINIITNNLTYEAKNNFNLQERRAFVKTVLHEYGDHHMISVFELAPEQLSKTSSGIHPKTIVAGRQAAYLGSANVTQAGLITILSLVRYFSGITRWLVNC